MSAQDRKCGTCKWWLKSRGGMGVCELPVAALPDCVNDVERDDVHELSGTTCPCWAPIGNGEVK